MEQDQAEGMALKALREIAALAPRCEEGDCEDREDAKGARRIATHVTTFFRTSVPLYLCEEHAPEHDAMLRKAESKGCGKREAVVPYEESNEAIRIALAALAEIDAPAEVAAPTPAPLIPSPDAPTLEDVRKGIVREQEYGPEGAFSWIVQGFAIIERRLAAVDAALGDHVAQIEREAAAASDDAHERGMLRARDILRGEGDR